MTKRNFWDKVVAKLTFKQYNRVMAIRSDNTYDAMFHAALIVSKSKDIRRLCLAGHLAPVKTRYSLLSVEGNSFGDQIIHYYDTETHSAKTLVNNEGSHVIPTDAILELNLGQ